MGYSKSRIRLVAANVGAAALIPLTGTQAIIPETSSSVGQPTSAALDSTETSNELNTGKISFGARVDTTDSHGIHFLAKATGSVPNPKPITRLSLWRFSDANGNPIKTPVRVVTTTPSRADNLMSSTSQTIVLPKVDCRWYTLKTQLVLVAVLEGKQEKQVQSGFFGAGKKHAGELNWDSHCVVKSPQGKVRRVSKVPFQDLVFDSIQLQTQPLGLGDYDSEGAMERVTASHIPLPSTHENVDLIAVDRDGSSGKADSVGIG